EFGKTLFMHTLCLAADVGFVHFADAAQKRRISVLNGFSDAVTQIPCGFVSDAQNALELQSRDALFRFANQIDRDKPFTQRQVRIVKDSSRSYREVIAAGCTLKAIALVV